MSTRSTILFYASDYQELWRHVRRKQRAITRVTRIHITLSSLASMSPQFHVISRLPQSSRLIVRPTQNRHSIATKIDSHQYVLEKRLTEEISRRPTLQSTHLVIAFSILHCAVAYFPLSNTTCSIVIVWFGHTYNKVFRVDWERFTLDLDGKSWSIGKGGAVDFPRIVGRISGGGRTEKSVERLREWCR